MKYISILIIIIINFASLNLQGQSVDVNIGCVPLTVQFSGPNQSTYFWDFGDNDSSDQENPQHIYVTPGDFTATLYDEEGGNRIGTVAIKVYEDVTIEIIPDTLEGCSPFIVNFNSIITKHPDINIESYNWAFGDGQSSPLENATNEYKTEGDFVVSLEVQTNIGECNKTINSEKTIKVEKLTSFFKADKEESCDVPSNFYFENLSDFDPSYTYDWDFGNGQTSNIFNPDSINYINPGIYQVDLIVDNGSLCRKTFSQIINVGSQIASEFELPTSICRGDTISLEVNVEREDYIWEIEGNYTLIKDQGKSITFVVNDFGIIEIDMTSTNKEGCNFITHRIIDIDYSADFNILPKESCTKVTEITLTADDNSYDSYDWSNSSDNNFETNLTIEIPERDSLYVNQDEQINQTLIITTLEGCKDTVTKPFISSLPNAHFIPSIINGFAPLTVTFSDFSTSNTEIIHAGWNYGDGQYEEHVGEFQHDHTFTEPGLHCVILDIENNVGCIDTSINICIDVFETIPIDSLSDNIISNAPTTSGHIPDVNETTTVCAGFTVELSSIYGPSSNIKIHFEGDDGRLDFCWEEGSAMYTMETPGIYPLIATREIGNLILDTLYFGEYEVLGTRSEFWYEYDCSDIKTVKFYDASSENTDKWTWSIDGEIISNKKDFTHHFTNDGTYIVTLETEDTQTGCPPHANTIEIVIAETIADFDVPSITCANENSFFSASKSQVFEDCCKPTYTWIFENLPKRKVIRDTLSQILNPGIQNVTLIVEDAIGCPDTITKEITVNQVKADFVTDSLICLPALLNFENNTQSISEIESYEWSFGSNEINPNHEFSFIDSVNDSIFVSLIAKDTFGCVDTLDKIISTYEIIPSILLDNNPSICVGQTINFTGEAIDARNQNVIFDWEHSELGSQNGPEWSVDFENKGTFIISMNYSLEDGNCANTLLDTIDVVNQPIAIMTSSIDGISPICAPKIIEFLNQSETDGPVTVTWVINDDEIIRNINNPQHGFEKGMHSVDLIVRSFYGCADTISQDFELVFPEGTFDIDVMDLCFGDEFTVSLNSDTLDIYEYVWDLGDGTIIENQNPVQHTYRFNAEGNRSSVDLVLKAAAEGCEIVESVPINIFEVLADFEIDTLNVNCNEVNLINTSLGGDTFEWYLNGGLVSNDVNPTISYPDNTTELEIQLVLSDNASGCISERTMTFPVNNIEYEIEFPNIFSPNGDMINDFFKPEITTITNTDYTIETFDVYNRWGNLIYQNSDERGWDGRYNNEAAPADVYAYFIQVDIGGCFTESKKGNITIVR